MLVIIIINIFGTCANSTYIINLLQEKLYHKSWKYYCPRHKIKNQYLYVLRDKIIILLYQ